MRKLKNLLAALGGALTLNILHETLKNKAAYMPRVDLLGEEAIQKTLHQFDTTIEDKPTLYKATLAADIVGNTLYYSMIGMGGREHLWKRAIFYGLSAGVGAVVLPKPLGLNPKPVTKNTKTQVLTIAYYLTGGLATGLILNAITEDEE
ncbi:hypothetical protein QRD02_00135 [Aequorivita sp. SDUM287046]|uniref:DUF1440 domain-containing protein n=1 Tax=Aequorivita aurantiaca TaxID=3053356 RepID=A0ABT8DDJ3_9FLAO|nr:hypothetical protein [Aequorivita aurantiaca]MDN3722773.1 hypothetical protein [Aequorivita aurantiaca]